MVGCLGLASCAGYQRSDLYFGRDIPGGGAVSEQQWKNFSDSVISNYFPEGYTEWDANGRWKDTDTKQTITEPTKVVTFLARKPKKEAPRSTALHNATCAVSASKACCGPIQNRK